MRRALLFFLLLAACDDKKGPGRGEPDAGPRYAAVDAGPLRQCAKAEDCAARGPGSLCYFPSSDLESPIGYCGGPQPPCVVSYPFCTGSGRTIYACTFPTETWAKKGACGDASAR